MVTIAAVRSGLGVAPLPCFLGDGERDLIRVGDPLEALTMDLWILTHPDLRNTARVKALLRYLGDALAEQQAKFEAEHA